MSEAVTVIDLERQLRRENLLTALRLAPCWRAADQARLARLAYEEFGEGCDVVGRTETAR